MRRARVPRRRIVLAGIAIAALLGTAGFTAIAPAEGDAATAATTTGPAPGSATLFPTDSASCGIGGATTNNPTSKTLSQHTATYSPSSATPSPTQPCRFAIEWRSGAYGPSTSPIPRRTLFWVYATAGQYIVSGSSEVRAGGNGTGNKSDIVIWQPDSGDFSSPSNLSGVSNATLDSEVDWRCSTGNRGSGVDAYGVSKNARGAIPSRAAEVGGAGSVNNATAGGYAPCYYQVPTTGFYAVAFYGPGGANDDADPGDAASSGLIGTTAGTSWAQLTAGDATRAWDLEVRDSASSTDSVAGRVFTYALAGITDGNPKPVDVTYWVTTRDGYRYRVETNGFDPNGFVLYGNNQGFLNADGTQLDHDILGGPYTGSGLQTLTATQGGTRLQDPQYAITFDGALDPVVEDGLSVPRIPIQPQLVPGSLSYDGQIADNESYSGQGGTFHVAAEAVGEVQLVVSRDGSDFDPTNPDNSTIRFTVASNQVTADPADPVDIAIPWSGKANDGSAFPPYDAAHPYAARATLQGGPYHLPMIDVESQIFGSPTITLENPPDVTGDGLSTASDCPQYTDPSGANIGPRSCTQAFFNDKGYTASDGTKVGRGAGTTAASTGTAATNYSTNDDNYICTTSTGTAGATAGTAWSAGLAPTLTQTTPTYQSNPYGGFNSDTERLLRAFGTSTGVNLNYPCNSNQPTTGTSTVTNGTTLGDAAGLDLWTFYPSASQTTHVVVLPAPPVAVDDYQALDSTARSGRTPTSGTYDVTANDSLGGLAATVAWGASAAANTCSGTSAISTTAYGAFTTNANGTWSYLRSGTFGNNWPSAAGAMQIPYTITTAGGSSSACLYVGSLYAADDAYETTVGTAITVAPASGVLANDLPATGTTARTAGNSTWGTTTCPTFSSGTASQCSSTGGFKYTPAANYIGVATASYLMRSGTTNSNTATLRIAVLPAVAPDSATVAAGGTTSGSVLTNDTPASSLILAACPTISPATAGTLTCTQSAGHYTGAWTFTAATGFSGTATAAYTAEDSAATVTASSVLTIAVTPVGVADTATTSIGTNVSTTSSATGTSTSGAVLANDRGSGLTAAAVVTQGAHGTLTFTNAATGDYAYAPNAGFQGTDTVTYQARDGSGQTFTSTVTITVKALAIQVRKLDASSTPIDGAAWALYSNADVADAHLVGTLTAVSGQTGLAQLGGLGAGTYWLVETQAPADQVLLAQPVQFALDAAGGVTVLSGGPAASVTQPAGSTPAVIAVTDRKAIALPLAGGTGLAPFVGTAAGLLLLAGLAVLLGRRRRIRRSTFIRPTQH